MRSTRHDVPADIVATFRRIADLAGLDPETVRLSVQPRTRTGLAKKSRRGGLLEVSVCRDVAEQPAEILRFLLAHETAHLALTPSRRRLAAATAVCAVALVASLSCFVAVMAYDISHASPHALLLILVAYYLFAISALATSMHVAARKRSREYAADAFAAHRLEAPLTPAVARWLAAREHPSSRWWISMPFRDHPLPERRLAAISAVDARLNRGV